MFELSNKVALVTGARRGMGRSHALALARQGAKVIVTDINKEECEPVANEIRAEGGEALAFKMDVTDISEINRVFDEAVKQFGRLDILVNNAGIFNLKPALEITDEDWKKTIDTNLRGEFFCAQKAAGGMAKNKWGRIINISSVASGGANAGIEGGAHYTASKGGILGLTKTLALEWAPLGITVNAIAPGVIDTPMTAPSQIPEKEMKGILSGIPLRRIGRPEEISAAVVFLASEEAGYITGETICVDGGYLAR